LPTGGGAPGENVGFAAETAQKTGITKRAINLAVSRANAIPEDVRDQIRGTGSGKGGAAGDGIRHFRLRLFEPPENICCARCTN
jgi:hypothetical protein